MDRQQRHDLKHDKFVDEIGALSARARDNQRTLYMIGGAAVAIAAIVFGIYFFRSTRESKAQNLLALAIETFEAPVGDQAQQQQPPATTPKFKTEAERNAAAEKQFKDVQSQYGGTDASDVANIYLARLATSKNDVKGAQALLKEFVDDHPNHTLASGARYSLYQLRIESGDAGAVATEIEAELKKSEPILPGDALLVLLAQAYDQQGNAEKSRDAYRRITTDFPESPYVVDAQRRAGQA
ncbi:MAG TPA: outer membrane protein assembly factor BamD [Thermoanaerobaculia bacterium]|nr:outer membrane protein assembly factor BamD [Thermoanaerobaculia bacterium]